MIQNAEKIRDYTIRRNGGYLKASLGDANKYRLEAYATLLSGLAREVWKSSCKRFRVPAATW
jgi:hypothetical protein